MMLPAVNVVNINGWAGNNDDSLHNQEVDVEPWQNGHGLLTMQKIISMRTSTIYTSCWGVIKYSGARLFVFDFA